MWTYIGKLTCIFTAKLVNVHIYRPWKWIKYLEKTWKRPWILTFRNCGNPVTIMILYIFGMVIKFCINWYKFYLKIFICLTCNTVVSQITPVKSNPLFISNSMFSSQQLWRAARCSRGSPNGGPAHGHRAHTQMSPPKSGWGQ